MEGVGSNRLLRKLDHIVYLSAERSREEEGIKAVGF